MTFSSDAPTIGPMIAASANLGLSYAERLLAGIEPARFASFARAGDRVIESNHPAFVCGHLSIYASRILKELGVDASSHEPSATFQELFSKDAKCVDDPSSTIYPAMDEISDKLLSGYQAIASALESAPDEIFVADNSNVAMRSKFPTTGAMHAFYVGGHFMLHMGQMSAWRRAMGMPSA